MNFQLTVGFSLGYMYFHMFNIRQKKEKKVDWICPFWNLVLLDPWKSLHGFVIPRCGYFIKFELFSSLKRQEFDQKVAKKFKCSTFSLSHPTPPPPIPSKKPLHLNIDTCITRNPAVSHHFSQYSTERQKRKDTLSGLSLRAGGRGFSPATKRVAPGYFNWKIEEK